MRGQAARGEPCDQRGGTDVTLTLPRSISAFAIGYAVATAVYAVEIIAASVQAADGERGFTFMTLLVAWLSYTPVIVGFAALVAPVGLALVRWRRLPRPAADALGAAMIAASSPFIAAFVLDALDFAGRGELDMESVFTILADAWAIAGLGAAFAALPGLFGGLAYWFAVGSPHAGGERAFAAED